MHEYNRCILDKVEEEFDKYRLKKLLLNTYVFKKEETRNDKKEE